MNTKFIYSALFSSMLLLTGCGGSDTDDDRKPQPEPSEPSEPTTPTETKIESVEAKKVDYVYSGDEAFKDKKPNTSFFVTDDNKLGIRVNGIQLIDGSDVEKLEISDVRILEASLKDTMTTAASRTTAATVASTAEISCEPVETGSDVTADKYDIVISLDTTASMGSHAQKSADKIVDFAGELASRGLDVRFAGITVGDAFATLKEGEDYGSPVVKGSLGAGDSSLDSHSRPDTGTTFINATQMQEFFKKISEKVSSGQGGGDAQENYLAALDYLNNSLNFREGAGRLFIAIGDNCAHTSTSLGSGFGDAINAWRPRAVADIEADFVNSGASVNLMWSNRTCRDTLYDMQELRKVTGGATTDLDGSLTDLPLINAVSSKRTTYACSVTSKDSTINVTFTIRGNKLADNTYGATWKINAILELSELK